MYIVHIFVWSFTTHRIYIGNKWMPFICDSMPGLTMHRIYSDNKSMPFRCHYCSKMPGLTTWLSRWTLPLNFGVLPMILLNDKSIRQMFCQWYYWMTNPGDKLSWMQICRTPFPCVVVIADIVAEALKFHITNLEENAMIISINWGGNPQTEGCLG